MHNKREDGFTLIELLVVIIILGILSAVVVFSVRGAKDKGADEAFATEERMLRTAEELHCAQKGEYGTLEQLKTEGYLKTAPGYASVKVIRDGNPVCGLTRFEITDPPTSPPSPIEFDWTATGPLNAATDLAAAVKLPDGKVLNIGSQLGIAEIYDPAAGTWTPTVTPKPPGFHSAAVLIPGVSSPACLNCGKVLSHWVEPPTTGFSLYDPATGVWSSAGVPGANWDYGTTLTVLTGQPCGANCGKVLVAGDDVNGQPEVKLFNPTAVGNPWEDTGALKRRHSSQPPTVTLSTGKILLLSSVGPTIGAPELYDPVTGSWADAAQVQCVYPGDPPDPHAYEAGSAVATLPNGKVLVATAQCAHIYDPGTGLWTDTNACAQDVPGCVSTLDIFNRITPIVLPDGWVLVTGNFHQADDPEGVPTTAYIYDYEQQRWSRTDPLIEPRDGHTAILLDATGRVLVAGGQGVGLSPGPIKGARLLTSSEIYGPVSS